jgi:hypothetical protein
VTRLLAAAVAVICLLVTVAPASADPINDYRRNGNINPCKYSDGQLKKGLGNLPPDVEQYAPGLADQLQQGREGCGGGSTGTPQTQAVPAPGNPTNGGDGSGGAAGGAGAAGAAAARPKAKILDPPAPKAAARTRLADVSTPAVSAHFNDGAPAWLAPVLIALLALAALAALVRFAGLGARFPRRRRRPRPPAGDVAAQLWDSVRLGR